MKDEKNRLGANRGDWKSNTQKKNDSSYVGACPSCRHNNGIVNVQSEHYGICHEHKCFWSIGSNIFHGYLLQDSLDRQLSAKLLRAYSKVERVEAGQ